MEKAESPIPRTRVVDLCTVTPAELDDLLQREERLWRERLLWDSSDTLAALRRVLERGSVPGKAVQVDTQTVGYAYYGIAGRLGVIAGLVVSPEWRGTIVEETLLRETVDAIQRQGVSRIESQGICIDGPWPILAFERAGFRTYWREFLRLGLHQPQGSARLPVQVHLEPWRGVHLREVAAIMQAAYDGGIDVEITARYRTVDGCRVALEHILNQGGCGMPVAAASALARHWGQGIGFVVITETAPRQGHLAQVAVLPEYQRQGVGRLLLSYSIAQLAACQFDTLSLIVSRANTHALRLYQAMGWQSVLAFPAFVWEQSDRAI